MIANPCVSTDNKLFMYPIQVSSPVFCTFRTSYGICGGFEGF